MSWLKNEIDRVSIPLRNREPSMTRTCLSPALLAAAMTASFASTAQEVPQHAPAEACAAIESDAARLTCYDHAFGRSARDTQAAVKKATAAASSATAATAKA